MIIIGQIHSEVPRRFLLPNILLLAGAGQNVGKTSFAVASVKHLKKLGYRVYGLKFTPHFHEPNPPYIVFQTTDFRISLEKDISGNKDSSRMLNAGAEEVFFVQTNNDNALPAAFDYIRHMAAEEILWVCESGGLRSFVEPGLFLYFKLKGQEPQKNSAKKLIPLADKIVEFDGFNFDFSPDAINIEDYQFKAL